MSDDCESKANFFERETLDLTWTQAYGSDK